MKMVAKNLTSKTFNDFIKNGVSIVDFSADWCMPCKIMSPIVDETANKIKNAKFGKVDVDKETELAQRFGVMSVPTLLFFKNKEQIDMTVGVVSKDELIKKVEKMLK